MDSWVIKTMSDECQYCEPPLQPDDIYLCKHPGTNFGKECEEEACPIASQPADAADALIPAVRICPYCKKKTFNNPCRHCGGTAPLI